MSGNPGGTLRALTPTPPERGSFPLDHDGECTKYMQQYLDCIKLVKGENGAINCRLKARDYLQCRMDNDLMDKSDFKSLGLPQLPSASASPSPSTTTTSSSSSLSSPPPQSQDPPNKTN